LTDEHAFRNAQGLDPTDDLFAEGLRHGLYFPELATLSTFKHY
jgi:hypothetical protein